MSDDSYNEIKKVLEEELKNNDDKDDYEKEYEELDFN